MALHWLTESNFYAILAFTFIICWMIYQYFKTRNYPPGPIGLPVVGFAPFMGKKPHEKLRNLSRKYGDIFSFYIGPKLAVCVSDYHLAKEILTHPEMLWRPPKCFSFVVGEAGFIGKNGEEWQEQRRFVMHTMRDLGLGKGLWETMTQESAHDFVNVMKSWKGQPTMVEEPLAYNQTNNSISLLIGRHVDNEEDAKTLETMHSTIKKLTEYSSSVNVTIVVPWTAKILEFFNIGGYNTFMKHLRKFEDIFRREVAGRMASKDIPAKDDFIGCYLQEMEKRRTNLAPSSFNVDNLLGSLVILYLAGNDSSRASLLWLFLLMAEHQEIQKKIHEEIDDVIGRDAVVYFEDRVKLPYTFATIMEMGRWAAIAAVFPPRYATSDLTFRGYTLPEGCHVICNIWAIMHDERYFKDPMEFRPERFLVENGTKVSKVDGYAPFSFGKRNCPGEGVAMMNIFLYFANIMQKFRVTMQLGKWRTYRANFRGRFFHIPKNSASTNAENFVPRKMYFYLTHENFLLNKII